MNTTDHSTEARNARNAAREMKAALDLVGSDAGKAFAAFLAANKGEAFSASQVGYLAGIESAHDLGHAFGLIRSVRIGWRAGSRTFSAF